MKYTDIVIQPYDQGTTHFYYNNEGLVKVKQFMFENNEWQRLYHFKGLPYTIEDKRYFNNFLRK